MNFLKQFIYLTFRLNKIDAIIIMFAGYWSVIPVLFGKIFHKKVFIILGGTDCVYYPTLNYGSLRKPLLRKAIYVSIKYATCLLPVHESLMEFTNSYYDNSKQGIKNHFKPINTPVRTIYNGYNPKVSKKTIETSNRIPNSFITVALVNNKTRIVLKGIDLILECAREFPEAIFTIIGIDNEIKNTLDIPTNVKILSPTSSDSLTEKYLQSEFVIQVSISEGFPNALCEAMSFGCIPIISPVGAMPTITENIGFTLSKRDPNELSLSIRNALNLNNEKKALLRLQAHDRIVNNFSEMDRISKLAQVIEEFNRI
ncbi:MAG: glycosyltransferase family 4 protein [Bacteroidota bacterium]